MSELREELNKAYIKGLDNETDKFSYWVLEHLRMSGAYWGLTAMDLLSGLEEMSREDGIKFVTSCFHEETGGFSGNVGHDPHLLYTLSAVQIMCLFDALDQLDTDKIVSFVKNLQQEDGSFAGDQWGEIDSRFSYCALSCMKLLGRIDELQVDKAVAWIDRCKNFDGAYGCIPGAESHAGQTFCCVGAMAITDRLDLVDRDLLGWWLAERQLPEGGLNGRPEKLPDVCYSWWVLSTLCSINRDHWIDGEKLKQWILKCQDTETGGFADRPGDMVDVFHTFFALAGLSFLNYPGLKDIDPVYALPVHTLKRMGFSLPWLQPESDH